MIENQSHVVREEDSSCPVSNLLSEAQIVIGSSADRITGQTLSHASRVLNVNCGNVCRVSQHFHKTLDIQNLCELMYGLVKLIYQYSSVDAVAEGAEEFAYEAR